MRCKPLLQDYRKHKINIRSPGLSTSAFSRASNLKLDFVWSRSREKLVFPERKAQEMACRWKSMVQLEKSKNYSTARGESNSEGTLRDDSQEVGKG